MEATTAARETALGAASGGTAATGRSTGGGTTGAPPSTPVQQGGLGESPSAGAATGPASGGAGTPQQGQTDGGAGQQRSVDISADDRALALQVRAAIERVCSHPQAIDTSEDGGTVTLRGAILRREVDRLLRAVLDTAGVRDVENRLEIYDSAEGVPAFEGASGR